MRGEGVVRDHDRLLTQPLPDDLNNDFSVAEGRGKGVIMFVYHTMLVRDFQIYLVAQLFFHYSKR